MNFETFNLHPHILSGVHALGYQMPTPIQQKSIPLILEGHDLLGLAQTGTGKTAAFGLPLLQRLIKGLRGRVRALIIVPTRELAQQIHGALSELGQHADLRSIPLYGGVNIMRQINSLRRGVEIVIACPGRLLDHLHRRTLHLGQVEMLVLDEADQMFDMGFLPNIQKILQHLPSPRQSLLFSATMPDALRKLAKTVLNQPVTVQIGQTAPASTVEQIFYPVAEALKKALLVKLLQTTQTQSVLIFSRTKHRVTQLAKQLHAHGFSVSAFQGNLSQSRRQATLRAFREGSLTILVATDVAARGIDIARISHVINFDMPDTVESYTHRIGRTGRMAQAGAAFTLITRSDTPRVRAVERLLDTEIVIRYLPDFDYQAALPSLEGSARPVLSHTPKLKSVAYRQTSRTPFKHRGRHTQA